MVEVYQVERKNHPYLINCLFLLLMMMMKQHSKYSLKPHQKSRFPTNWASGGPGMQAIFLDSGRRSCGTGVFLPRRAGTNFQPSKKPGNVCLVPVNLSQSLVKLLVQQKNISLLHSIEMILFSENTSKNRFLKTILWCSAEEI